MSLRTFFRVFAHAQMLPALESGEETLVGGQAVMEGVMMRAPHSYCVAVRKPDGEIVTEEKPLARMSGALPDLQISGLARRRHALPGHEAGHTARCASRPTRRSRTMSRGIPEPQAAKETPQLGHEPSTCSSRSPFSSSCISSCRC